MTTKSVIHIAIPTAEVPIPAAGDQNEDQVFVVRGINASDLSYLVGNHMTALSALYGQYVTGQISFTKDRQEEALNLALEEVPGLLGALIERATDGVVDAQNALRLPFTVQFDAVVKTGELTFAGDDALGKFLTTLTKLMDAATNSMVQATASQILSRSGTPSTDGQ